MLPVNGEESQREEPSNLSCRPPSPDFLDALVYKCPSSSRFCHVILILFYLTFPRMVYVLLISFKTLLRLSFRHDYDIFIWCWRTFDHVKAGYRNQGWAKTKKNRGFIYWDSFPSFWNSSAHIHTHTHPPKIYVNECIHTNEAHTF